MIRTVFSIAAWCLLILSWVMLSVSWMPVVAPVLWTVCSFLILAALALLWRHRERVTERARDRLRRALRWAVLALLINLGVTVLMQIVSRQATIEPLRDELERIAE